MGHNVLGHDKFFELAKYVEANVESFHGKSAKVLAEQATIDLGFLVTPKNITGCGEKIKVTWNKPGRGKGPKGKTQEALILAIQDIYSRLLIDIPEEIADKLGIEK